MAKNISPLFEDDQASDTDLGLFSSGFNTDINQLINPPSSQADAAISGSELSPALAPSSPSPLFNPVLASEVNRTKGANIDGTVGKDKPGAIVSSLSPLSAGLAAGNQFQASNEGDITEAVAGVGASTLGGVVSGALSGAAVGAAGGPIGAGAGAIIGGISALVISGTKAWFGVRNSRRRNRALKELARKAERQRLAEIARNEKWKKINQFNTVQQAETNRKQTELVNKWQIYEKVAKNMTNLMNSDANLNQIMRNNMQGVT